jgi:transcriptional regulator with XRE-family HTH domain
MARKAIGILDGPRLQQAIAATGLNQAAFARRAFLRVATVSEAINGKPVSPETLFRLGLALEQLLATKGRDS